MIFKEYKKEVNYKTQKRKVNKTNNDVIERRIRIARPIAKDVDTIIDVLNFRNNELFTKQNGKCNNSIIFNIAISDLIGRLKNMTEADAEKYLLSRYIDVVSGVGRKNFNTKKTVSKTLWFFD